jgi:hypothetical protein
VKAHKTQVSERVDSGEAIWKLLQSLPLFESKVGIDVVGQGAINLSDGRRRCAV